MASETADRLRPRRGGRPGRGKLTERLQAAEIGMPAGAVPERDRCERVRIESDAGGQIPGPAAAQAAWMGTDDAPPHPALMTPAALLGTEPPRYVPFFFSC